VQVVVGVARRWEVSSRWSPKEGRGGGRWREGEEGGVGRRWRSWKRRREKEKRRRGEVEEEEEKRCAGWFSK
jgi:hypothetical protein